MEKLDVPTPRRKIDWLSVVPDLAKLSAGTNCVALSMLGLPCAVSASPATTDTAKGTRCSRSERFCAVTTISAGLASLACSSLDVVAGATSAAGSAGGVAVAGSAVWANAGVANKAKAAVPTSNANFM